MNMLNKIYNELPLLHNKRGAGIIGGAIIGLAKLIGGTAGKAAISKGVAAGAGKAAAGKVIAGVAAKSAVTSTVVSGVQRLASSGTTKITQTRQGGTLRDRGFYGHMDATKLAKQKVVGGSSTRGLRRDSSGVSKAAKNNIKGK